MPITQQLADEARNDIISFIRQILVELENIIKEPRGPEGLFFLEDMMDHLEQAWSEFQEDFYSTADLEGRVFETSDQVLQDHGLYGAQREGKRRLFDIRFGIFDGQRTKRALLRLLDAMDTYLDSIIDATGLNKSLKEIKDILRNSIDD